MNSTVKQFQKEILDWYGRNKRDLPWRHTRDPYRILISEVMLQQTQVARVIPKYHAWLEKFPTIQSLSQASIGDVLSLWSGLGYNRRALYLQRLAQELVRRQEGRSKGEIFPQTERELIALPGIGKYTARAILCFAFNKQVAVVDTNVRKVILTKFLKESRMINYQSLYLLIHDSARRNKEAPDKKIQHVADTLLPASRAYEWNQALMDYAAAMLKDEKIPIKKQSHFKDSDRYYRGAVIRLLLQKKQVSLEQFISFFQNEKKAIGQDRLKKILKNLEKDLLIKNDYLQNIFSLP